MFKKYQLKIKFTGRLLGGVPLKAELVRPWLEARKPYNPPENPTGKMTRTLDKLEQAVLTETALDEEVETVTKGFLRDASGQICVGGFTVRAHLKDCANVIKGLLDEKNLKAKLADRVYVAEDLILVMKGDEAIQEPDGFHEHPTHVMTARGPRTSLSRSEYVLQPTLTATLMVLDDRVITERILRTCLDYGTVHGYGAERSMQEGRYTYELSEGSH